MVGLFDTGSEGARLEISRNTDGSLEALLPGEPEANRLTQVASDTLVVPRAGITLIASARESGSVTGIVAVKPDQGGRGPAYSRFLMEELRPMIDSYYRTDPDAISVGGSSLGGLISLYLGANYPEIDGILAASPSVWWNDRSILDSLEKADLTGKRIWVDVGGAEGDGMVGDARSLDSLLTSMSAGPDRVAFVEGPGATHHELAWASRFADMLRFLYGK